MESIISGFCVVRRRNQLEKNIRFDAKWLFVLTLLQILTKSSQCDV